MITTTNTFITRNSVFLWIAVATCVVLLVPFGAMQVTSAVNWSISDFITMGALLFVAGSVFVLVARKVSSGWRWAVGALVAIAFFCIWAELAVGIFTRLGS